DRPFPRFFRPPGRIRRCHRRAGRGLGGLLPAGTAPVSRAILIRAPGRGERYIGWETEKLWKTGARLEKGAVDRRSWPWRRPCWREHAGPRCRLRRATLIS